MRPAMKHKISPTRVAAALVLTTLSVSASLAAQQTKLGAQTFMNQVFSQRASSLEIDARMGEWNRMPARWQKCVDERYACSLNEGCLREVCGVPADDRHYYTVPAYSISETASASSDACRTTFQVFKPSGIQRQVWESGKQFDVTPQVIEGPFDISWSSVASVEDKGGYIYVMSASNNQYSMRFRIPNENLRVRMAYAMEFLRSRCDPMAATGF
jgi:hypothetical protein